MLRWSSGVKRPKSKEENKRGAKMLYMVVATHGPDTCAGFVEEAKQKMRAMAPRMEEIAKAHGVTMKGAWTAMVAHTTFMLVDAPGGHTIQDFVAELELQAWNTIVMYPVETLQEAMQKVK
jgi:hypothetical protein